MLEGVANGAVALEADARCLIGCITGEGLGEGNVVGGARMLRGQ